MADATHELRIEDGSVTILKGGEVVSKWDAGEIVVTNTYPYESDGVILLGPGIFATLDSSAINWNGQNYVPQKAPVEHPPLKDYKVGERVEVFKNGEFMPGFIQGKDHVGFQVHTDRGPVTVASHKAIRKIAK